MHNCLLMFLIILSLGYGFISCITAQQEATQLLEVARNDAQECVQPAVDRVLLEPFMIYN